MKACKLADLRAAVEFLIRRAALSSRLAFRPTSGGHLSENTQYAQLHYAGDRARGIHFQFVSILNVLQPASDKDSLTTTSIYDNSKSYDRVHVYLKEQTNEFDNLDEKVSIKIKYPNLTEEQHNQPEIRLGLSILEQIKQNKVPRVDLLPTLLYPKRIPKLKPFQGIKVKELEKIIDRKFVWSVNPAFEKQTELASREVKNLNELSPGQVLVPCYICHRMFSDQIGATHHCLLEHERNNLPKRTQDPRVKTTRKKKTSGLFKEYFFENISIKIF